MIISVFHRFLHMNNNITSLPSYAQFPRIADEMESRSAHEVLKWGIDNYDPKISLASSFGAEDVILIDMMTKIDKTKSKIFTLDTGRLNQETYDIIDVIRKKYGIQIKVYFPKYKEVEDMVQQKGVNLMYESLENRKLCCKIRKVDPLNRALGDLDAWITGLRREQTVTRANIRKIEIDSSHGSIIKINPLADWTDKMVWEYIYKNNIPYNKLHDMGFPSIGCEPCTRAVQQGEDPRSGRWWWENTSHKECGLHWDPITKHKK